MAGMHWLPLANGDVARIDLQAGKIVEGGFHVGGTMPEMLIYLEH